MTKIYIIILFIFITVVSMIGILSAKRTKSDEDWFVAGHSLGVITSLGTYFATIISSVTIISNVGYIYLNGLSGAWVLSGTFLTSILAVSFYAVRLRKVGKVSLPDYLEERFGKIEGILGTILILVASVFTLCVQITAGASVLETITDWGTLQCTMLFSILLVFLTSTGGMISVAWTDTLCTMVMFIGIWIMAGTMLTGVGGLNSLKSSLYSMDPVYMDWKGIGVPMILSWIFTWGIGNFGVPQFVTRFFVAKDDKTARRSQKLLLLLFLLFYIPLVIVGLAGIVMLPGIQVQDEVTFSLVESFLNPTVGGLVLVAILASCVSTADSILLLSSVTVTNDIYKKYINKITSSDQLLKVSKATTWIVCVFAMVASLLQSDAILWLQARMVTLMGAAMAPSVLIGIVWKKANKGGGLASFFVGLTVALIWYALAQPFNMMPMLPAFIAGMISMIVGSMIYRVWERRRE